MLDPAHNQSRALGHLAHAPCTIGVELPGGLVAPLMPRNCDVVAGRTLHLTTAHDNQGSALLHVVEGNARCAGNCASLGYLHIPHLPPGPAGYVDIQVTMQLRLGVSNPDLWSFQAFLGDGRDAALASLLVAVRGHFSEAELHIASKSHPPQLSAPWNWRVRAIRGEEGAGGADTQVAERRQAEVQAAAVCPPEAQVALEAYIAALEAVGRGERADQAVPAGRSYPTAGPEAVVLGGLGAWTHPHLPSGGEGTVRILAEALAEEAALPPPGQVPAALRGPTIDEVD